MVQATTVNLYAMLGRVQAEHREGVLRGVGHWSQLGTYSVETLLVTASCATLEVAWHTATV